jgi:2-oxo-3-hexenedioate decarboxylase
VPASTEAAAALEAVEWMALGFEIVDSPFPEWRFHPVDFVASFGLHAALYVGEPRPVAPGEAAALLEPLAALKVILSKDDTVVEEGLGKNALRNPAACLGELASAIAAQPGAEPLRAGELVSTGTLTAAYPVAGGERWRAEAVGLDLGSVTLAVLR